jgi:hypothetical protein
MTEKEQLIARIREALQRLPVAERISVLQPFAALHGYRIVGGGEQHDA